MNNHRRYVYIVRHPEKESLGVYITDKADDTRILNHIEMHAHENNDATYCVVDVYKEYSDHIMKLHNTHVFGKRP